ncbi:MAG: CotH kinase family protein [Clostridia bacterium]|nr:CotH kinase family protein [Clostridia bacterium]
MYMKNKLLFLFLVCFCLLLFLVSCGDDTPDSTSVSTTSQTTSDAITETSTQTPPVSTTPITTTAAPTTPPETEAVIPQSYYTGPGALARGSRVVIPAKYNKGIACDIHPSLIFGTLYFFLPSTADLSQVVYEVYNADGTLSMGRVADFTSDTKDFKKIAIGSRSYIPEVYISSSPALFLEIDEEYGTFEDVKYDKTKETKAYGKLIITCREDIAEEKGWKTYYSSREDDSNSPGSMYIKGRGNWTWISTDKKGFSIKLEKKEELLGMTKSKKWALVGNMPDATMLRNSVASYLGHAAEFAYTPSSELVDVFVNGVYQGSYLLSEKISIGEGRIEMSDLEDKVEDLMKDENYDYGEQKITRDNVSHTTIKYWTNVKNPADITGGYIIEMEMSDRYKNEPSGFVTRRGVSYVIKSPEYASREQVSYIAAFVQEMENAIFSSNGINSKTGKHYTAYMDLDSFVKKYWVDEITKNRDGAKTSHYLYKPADSQSTKIYAGPLWDYDITLGIHNDSKDPKGWFSRTEKDFYRALFLHDDFQKRANEIFFDIFYPAVTKLLDGEIDAMAKRTQASAEMNDVLWHVLEKDYTDHVEDLKKYLTTRITWIKNEIS